MSDLGERGKRLRRLAAKLQPAPAIPPFYVQVPDEVEIRSIGWHMRRTRKAKPLYLGHSAPAAEAFLRRELERQEEKARTSGQRG